MRPYPKFILNTVQMLVLSALTGILAGGVCTIFGRVLFAIGDFRDAHYLQLFPFLCFAGYAIGTVYTNWGGECIRGMALVFETEWDKAKRIPRRAIPVIIGATWLTHLFGGSAGRESVAVQVGADIGFNLGRIFHNARLSRTLLVAGIAAGFAGLFGTPIAAVFFALEVIVAGQLDYEALVPAITAALTAAEVARAGGLIPEHFALAVSVSYTPVFYVKIVLLAFIFSLTGQLFSWSLGRCKCSFEKKFPDLRYRAFYAGIVISIASFLLFRGRYAGLGSHLTEAVFSGGTIYPYDWILKLVLTVITLSAGFQGGELMPLFVIGSLLGSVLSAPFGMPVAFCAALGYVAVFAGATNTFLAPVAIGCEVFGSNYLFVFFIVCAIARVMNGNRSIYACQKRIIWDPGKLK
jgi:H+/Cl- antiporter ClcA